MRSTAALAVALLILSSPAFAAKGEVCVSTPTALTGGLTNSMVFKCPTAGNVTIPQIYEKGWRVVFGLPQMSNTPGQTKTEWALVIEKI
jgi:hypothetical protein